MSPFVFASTDGPKQQWLPHLGAAAFVVVVATLTRTDASRGAAAKM